MAQDLSNFLVFVSLCKGSGNKPELVVLRHLNACKDAPILGHEIQSVLSTVEQGVTAF